MSHTLIHALAEIVGPDGILADPNELRVYECDGFPVAKGVPRAVVFPRDTEQVARCVRVLAEHDVPIVPRGSGTGLAGGAVSFDQGVLISTSRMTRVESIDLENRVAVAQAGVRNLSLSEAVAAEQARRGDYEAALHFSPDPSSQRASTVGGNASTNAGGINTLKHGVTTNHVLGVEIVLADGEVVQTRTGGLYDGMGPDLPGLLCGSEGTFGILTRIWCRLTPKPQHLRTVYAVFNSTKDACLTVSDTIAAGIIPTSMEMMDGAMVRVVEDAFHYGFPIDAQAMLLIEIDGIEAALDEQLDAIIDIARRNGATDVQACSEPKRRAELWSARKRAFGAIGRISRSYCTQDACVPRSMLPEVIETVGNIGDEFGLKIANVFHAGDGNIHPILLFDEDDPEQVQRVLEASERILSYCISIGGTLTGEHGVGVEKIHLMRVMFNDATIDTFRKIKDALDPAHRVNDAKLIPSTTLEVQLLKPAAINSPGGAM